jgi:hypothetical protein
VPRGHACRPVLSNPRSGSPHAGRGSRRPPDVRTSGGPWLSTACRRRRPPGGGTLTAAHATTTDHFHASPPSRRRSRSTAAGGPPIARPRAWPGQVPPATALPLLPSARAYGGQPHLCVRGKATALVSPRAVLPAGPFGVTARPSRPTIDIRNLPDVESRAAAAGRDAVEVACPRQPGPMSVARRCAARTGRRPINLGRWPSHGRGRRTRDRRRARRIALACRFTGLSPVWTTI